MPRFQASPVVGQTVRYVPVPGVVRAAIVTGLCEDGTVNLHIFANGHAFYNEVPIALNVEQDATAAQPGTWHHVPAAMPMLHPSAGRLLTACGEDETQTEEAPLSPDESTMLDAAFVAAGAAGAARVAAAGKGAAGKGAKAAKAAAKSADPAK